jgi:glycosyltransferase involved in cell wall biosynthesis
MGSPPDPATADAPAVVEAKMWPWIRSPLDRALNRTLLARQLVPRIARMSRPPIAVTTLPIVADLVGVLPVERWIYYCVDDFGSWPGLDRRALGRLDERLIRSADVLIAASAALRDRIDHLGREAHLLTHGVDVDHWSTGPDADLPRVDELESPLIVFWGVIDRRMDVEYLRALDSGLTGGTILLVGPEDNPDPALGFLKRVVRLPAMPYEHLPALARRASVLVMPYADLPVTRAMQPLKMAEYLATDRPVVARRLPSTEPWGHALDLIRSPGEFAEAVRLRLDTGLPDSQRRARGPLAGEGWSAKAGLFEGWVFGPSPSVGAPGSDRAGRPS